MTTRVGAKAAEISAITTLESDLPPPRANGCSKMNGGYSSNRGSGSPLGIWQRSALPTRAPASFGKFKITFDRVISSVDFGNAIVKEPRAFTGIAHSVDLFRAADLGNERAAKQSLEIEGEIGSQHSRAFPPWPKASRGADSGEIIPGKNVDMIDIRISAKNWRELGINHPCDLGLRVSVADERDRRQRVNDIAE